MRVPIAARLASLARAETTRHLLLIVLLSVGFESLFVHHGIAWLFDEGWPLYAAMQLQAGGVLYGDVFFLFPPGHLIPAWIAYALDPPGVILSRAIYSAFTVSLCVALYALGRRVMTPPFAVLAALLLAVAAPRSHLAHLLFGYRYLVFSVVALLFFSARLRTGNRMWMFAAGIATGVALFFRLTPAFAVGCGIGVAVMSSSRDWRVWRGDWLAFAGGIVLVTVPVLAWFGNGVGLNAVWEQAVARILPLQAAQSKEIAGVSFPTSLDRDLLYRWFVPVQYRLYPAIYAAYGLTLAWSWARAIRARERFEHSLLLAIAIWGAIYMLRAIGRSDEHHLTSALPPVCLLIAHGVSLAFDARRRGGRASAALAYRWAACIVVFAVWIVLQGSDLYLARAARGNHPLRSLDSEVRIGSADRAARIDRSVRRITRLTPGDRTVLDLTHAPLLHVLADRRGPGYGDVVTPGVFADPEDERAFIAQLEREPPALILWPLEPFDRMPSRSLEVQAPRLSQWVRRNYEPVGGKGFREIALVPRR